MFTKRHPGFTLIELLVIIAIIAILTAILLPVFASARHRARMAACASNLHQISLALRQYAADSDGNYPPDDPILAHTPHLVWTLLIPYTRSADVFRCPEAQGKYEKEWGYQYINGALPYFNGDAPVFKAPRPGSGTVVALCEAHTERDGSDGFKRDGSDGFKLDAQGRGIGPLVVVCEDGSTSQIQASLVESWIYRRGQWIPGRGVKPQPGDLVRARFPGEEWPPQD